MEKATDTQAPPDEAVTSTAGLGLWSILVDAGVVLSVWLAVNGSVPCGYVTQFLAAVAVVLSPTVILAAFVAPGKREPVKEVMSHVSDGLTVAILVWHGWLWCAGGFGWGWLCCSVLFAARKAHAMHGPNTKLSGR